MSLPQEFDPEEIIDAGVEAIRAVGKRMADAQPQGDAETQPQWFLGASQPTPLDALLFALLHVVLSSSASPPPKGAGYNADPLRSAILSFPALTRWAQDVYRGYVREREVRWREGGEGERSEK